MPYYCNLNDKPLIKLFNNCQFSMGIDIGGCYDCPHLTQYAPLDLGSAGMVAEGEPIPVEDIPVQQEDKEKCEQKLLVENPDFLEID